MMRPALWPSTFLFRLVSPALGFLLLAAVTLAQDGLQVDFTRAPDDEPLQEGWLPFVGDGTDAFTRSYQNDQLAGPGGSVDVTIDGYTGWRDYREATGQFEVLSDLLRDGPNCNRRCLMVFTLENLADGSYEVRTYHHTTQFGQQDGRPFTPFEIRLSDGVVTDRVIVPDKLESDNLSDELSTETIPFHVVGGSSVEIVLEKFGGDDHMTLSGFQLATAGNLPELPELVPPEPAVVDPIAGGLNIDFSRMPDELPLQEGWLPFVGDGTDAFTESYQNDQLAGRGGSVDLTIEGYTGWRDYRAATGIFESISDLVSDGPLCNDACEMTVTLEDLLDGSYELTAVFHTTQFGPQYGRPFTPFDILLTDGEVTDELVVEGKKASDDLSAELSIETIPFRVTGGSPVQITFAKPGNSDHLALPALQVGRASTDLRLMPGDADMDWDFDQLDLVKVQVAAKYLTGLPATWGDGDWNGAPGGKPGDPPPGDGLFNQLDIVGALGWGVYLTGPYARSARNGKDVQAALAGLGRPADSRTTTIPEPAAVLLLGLGMVILDGRLRRQW